MKCSRPLRGWVGRELTKAGRRPLVFRGGDAFLDLHREVPCGSCPSCLVERSRQWATRCVHEASQYRENAFVTLTYSSENLPMVGSRPSLRPADFVLFMKRLRKARGPGVRFLQAGEYGSLGRPHHHALLFNCSFSDKRLFQKRKGGDLYRSAELEELWPWGYSSVAAVTFETAAYVARYTVKKAGRLAEVVGVVPEYITMSRGGRSGGGGIGQKWWRRYGKGVMANDRVIVRGAEARPPRFYDKLFERFDPTGYAAMKRERMGEAGPVDAVSAVELRARELNQRGKLALSRRTL